MHKIQSLFVVFTVVFQGSAILLLFFNVKWAIALFICYGLSLVILFGLIIRERMKEKREEDEHDYSDY